MWAKFIDLSDEDTRPAFNKFDVENGGEIGVEEAVMKAMKYFTGKLERNVRRNFAEIYGETLFAPLMHQSADYVNKTEVEAFNYILRMHGESMNENQKVSGREAKWSKEELPQLLESYEQKPPVVKQNDIKQNCRRKRGWRDPLSLFSAKLPSIIIERLLNGEIQPRHVSVSRAAEQSGKELNEYLRQLLIKKLEFIEER